MLTAILQNVRRVLRTLGRRPMYATITILVLAIAIGANTTVFSVLDAFLLRPLPYLEGDRLVAVYDSYPKLVGLDMAGTAIPDYLERRAQAKSLEDLAIVATGARTLRGDGAPEEIIVGRASPSLFNVLRVAPTLGRIFDDAEATIGNDRVAVLSDSVWRTRFGARPDVVGRDIRLNGEELRIIGVLPKGFSVIGQGPIGVWVPFAFTPAQMTDAERGRQFSMSFGRLRSGATLEGLNTELAAIAQQNIAAGVLPREAFEATGFTGKAQPLRNLQVGNLESMLLILQASVLAVLLIACANVANLQLARVAERRKELAMRAALGAGARRLIHLVLAESMTLALLGALAGVVLAAGGLELVRALGLEQPGFEFALNAPVLAFTFGMAAFAAMGSALPPVIALLRDDLMLAVREAGRVSAGRGAHALRNALVVAQIAMSVALLVGAGLLTKSFLGLQQEGAGFNAGGLWTARIALPRTRYTEPETWAAFEDQTLARLRALPGVSAAGFTVSLPFSGSNNQGSMAIDGFVPPPGVAPPHAQSWTISEGYLPALQIPVTTGRNFAATEAERVAIVDQNLASKYWPGANALGQRVRMVTDPPDQWYTIVGVVPAVKQGSLAEDPRKETVYWHYKQRQVSGGAFAVRSALSPDLLTRPATAAIAELDPDLALFNIQSMDARVARSLGPQRTPMVLTIVFAAVAFFLAVIGVYGVLSWAVTQRIGEIAVRVALGAQRRDIGRMVLGQGGRLIMIGAAIGVAGAWALGVALASQIRNVSALDPVVIAIAVVGLGGAALLASWLPARRAAGVDPMQALRGE
ncbi:MAG: ABC transporter permease [Gammaproteobacteria bacterium]